MEFHDLGKHCSAEFCNQQDFLPFTCNGCNLVFCLQHRTHATHDCTNANFNDKRVLECSACNKVLKSQPGVSRDVTLQRHMTSGCLEGVRKTRPNKLRCSAPGCRGSEFVKVSCKSCAKNFCFRHRHEDDHKCEVAAAIATTRRRAGPTAGGPVSNPRQALTGARSSTSIGQGCAVEAKAAADRRASAVERRTSGDRKFTDDRGAEVIAH